MAKVSVIYRAPKGDSKIVEWGAFTFFDGIPVEIEDNDDNAHMIHKMSINRYFELSEMGEVTRPEVQESAFDDYVPIEEVVRKKRGRPRKVVLEEDDGSDEDEKGC